MADLYAQLKQYEKNQATKFPTSGSITRIDGSFIDVNVGTSIIRNVRVVGNPTSSGQSVVLSWENGTPTAHITGGSTAGSSVALVRGPAGAQGETGPAGPTGAQGPQGPTGSLTAASAVNLTELSSTPPNPAAGLLSVYAKTDHKVYQLQSDGTEKVIGGREMLTADRTYYVRTDGNDSNTGLVNSAGGAFLTIQKAIDVAAALDMSTYNVTIQLADGTYSPSIVTLKSYLGSGLITIQGNAGIPANVHVNPTTYGFQLATQGRYVIKDLKITPGSGYYSLHVAASGASIGFSNLVFGSAGTGYHLYAANSGSITCQGSYSIVGGANGHIVATTAGQVRIQGPLTVTITGSPTFATAFAMPTDLGYLLSYSVTWTGALTAKKYQVTGNAVCQTYGAGINYFPGGMAGTTASGGQYL